MLSSDRKELAADEARSCGGAGSAEGSSLHLLTACYVLLQLLLSTLLSTIHHHSSIQWEPFAPVTKTTRRAATSAAATAASRSCALQEPWQPATQILSMADYAAMEGDSVKYERYQLAIVDALCDIMRSHPASGAALKL